MTGRDEDAPVLSGDAFTLPADGEHEPKEIAGRLVADLDQFRDLRTGEAMILFLMRTEPKVKAQRAILGEMCIARFQGTLAPLALWLLAKVCGEVPDYIMILDAGWWEQADPHAREALVFHELCHCAFKLDKEGEPKFTEDGAPIWDIRGHEIEEFNAVAERYGAWKPDIAAFLRSVADYGGAAE